MDSPISLALAFAVGALMGGLFFTGLWFTVQRLPQAGNPLRLMLGSAALRLGVVLPSLALIAEDSWGRLGMAFLGFLAMRTLLILRWRPTPEA
ncbi:MAG: ATP synthase subunit I [Synechococcaceae cyanobacterium]